MSKKGPGKAHRDGINLVKLIRVFPDDSAARDWLESQLWPHGPQCPRCESFNVQSGIKHSSMTHRCRDCNGRPMFSLRKGTIMEGSHLGYQTWAIAIYLLTTSLKGVSAMKLHRDLKISYRPAWHLMHRLRMAYEMSHSPFSGPVEADETWIGGKRKNMPKSKRKRLTGRGPVGKRPVVGVKDRATGRVKARSVNRADGATLRGIVEEATVEDARVYTDDATGYRGMNRPHEAVNHSVGEYVRGMAHTNGIESFWAMLKRGHDGTFHKISPKHLDRYVTEFAGRHNDRNADTLDQMERVVCGMSGKRLRYRDLTADNGLSNGVRS